MIKKTGSRYRLMSKTTGRNLGTFKTKTQAQKREKQVLFFKNLAKSKGGKGSLRSKIKKPSLLKGR